LSTRFFIFPPEWIQRTIIILTHRGGVAIFFCSRFVHVWIQNWNKSGTKGERVAHWNKSGTKSVAKMRDKYATQLAKWLKYNSVANV
jgi:hypothetical protein